MADPLSSLASIITIAGSATDTIGVLLKFLHRFRNAPARVRQWLTILESLHSTLSSLQQCALNLDPTHQFSSHFQQRLLSCVAQLQICSSEVARIDADLVKASLDGRKKWDHRAKRSWERAKWAIVGDHKMKKVMGTMNLYHFEFSMELLKVLVSLGRILSPPQFPPVIPPSGPLQEQQPTGTGNQSGLAPAGLSTTVSRLTIHPTDSARPLVATSPHPNSSLAAVEYECLNTGIAHTVTFIRSRKFIKSAFSIYWNFSACRFMIRAGPVIKLRSDDFRKAHSKRYQQVGFGLILSVYPPQQCRQSLNLAVCNFQMMVMNGSRLEPYWSMSFPKTVPPDDEVFASARAGLTENVKRLVSLGKASAKDTTMFGTTLLHSASKSGSLELVCLLIQEGADVNARDEDGESPLHSAMARNDNYNVARTLIENGADLSSKAIDGKTPFHNIFNNTISQVLMRDEWLENILPDSEAMSISHFLAWSSKSTLEIFQRGRSYDDADLLSADNIGRTCLHFAASRGNLGVLSYLVSRVSSEDLERQDTQGRTPFHYAAESSRAAGVIDTLVGRGCNIDAVDHRGLTALHWAARWHNVKAVKKLMTIVGGKNLLLYDTKGNTPSQEVCQRKAPALYSYLRDLEASRGLNTDQTNVKPPRPGRATQGAGLGFPLILNIVGISALVLMMFLGSPD